MPTFAYEAYQGSSPTSGSLDAPSESAARSALRAQGLLVTGLAQRGGAGGLNRQITLSKRVKLTDVAWMARQIAITTEAGMPLPRALAMLARQRPKDKVGTLLADLNEQILSGRSATAAFRSHEEEIGSLFCAMVASGERSGTLGPSLAKLANLLEVRDRLRKKVRSAMMYPTGVLGLSVVLGLVMVIFIVPIFAKLFAQLGGALPLPTKILMVISHILTHNIWVLPVVGAAAVIAWRRARSRHDSRRRLDAMALRLPVVGGLLTKAVLARVASTLATMLDTGVPLLDALGYASEAAGNLVFADALNACVDDVRAGTSLSDSLGRYPEIPEVLPQMIRVGEDAGSVAEVLSRYAKRIEVEVETAVEGLAALLEPVLVVVVGGMVGSMIISLYLPVFRIITVLGKQKP